MDIKKNQKVWLKIRSNEPIETTINSIGRKYITLNHDKRIKFDIDTLSQVGAYGIPQLIILDIDKYNQEVKYSRLVNKIERTDWTHIETEKINKIAKILGI